MKTRSILLIAVFFALGACKKNRNNDGPVIPADLKTNVINQSLTFPWEITWGPDNKIWMTERGGKISRVDPETGAATLVINIAEVKSMGEGGLLGMALHPDFASTPEVFVAYDYDKAGIYTGKIVKFTYNGTTLVSPVVLLDNIPASTIHNGSRLAFSPDKKLFISLGDGSISSNAQNRSSLSGKILRMNSNGSIPSDNPDPQSLVWTLGHRNPQGLVFVGDRLYSSEHGNTTDDEVNIITKGKNYGWPVVEGYCNLPGEQSSCISLNAAEPIMAWSPTIAPSGIDYYNNDMIPQWKNSLLLAVLKDSYLVQIKLDAAGERVVSSQTYYQGTYGRLRDVCVSPDGRVFLITSNGISDKLIRIGK